MVVYTLPASRRGDGEKGVGVGSQSSIFPV